MKNGLWPFIVIFFISAVFTGCARTVGDIVASKPCVKGVVVEVTEQAITIRVDEDEEEHKSSDVIRVSLAVQYPDSMTHFKINDQVAVYYDGNIAESYPAQINTVYAITTVG